MSPAASGTASLSSPEAGARHGHFVDVMGCENTASRNAGDAVGAPQSAGVHPRGRAADGELRVTPPPAS